MTRHLSPREIVDALDATLGERRVRHLDGCRRCQAEVDAARSTVARLASPSGVPEPPAEFWNDLQRDVRRRTGAEPAGAPRVAWAWRVLAFAAPAAVAIAVLVAPEVSLPVVPGAVEAPEAGVEAPDPDDLRLERPTSPPAWNSLADLANRVPADDLRVVAPVRAGVADDVLEDLTAAERTELMRLIRAEMGGGL